MPVKILIPPLQNGEKPRSLFPRYLVLVLQHTMGKTRICTIYLFGIILKEMITTIYFCPIYVKKFIPKQIKHTNTCYLLYTLQNSLNTFPSINFGTQLTFNGRIYFWVILISWILSLNIECVLQCIEKGKCSIALQFSVPAFWWTYAIILHGTSILLICNIVYCRNALDKKLHDRGDQILSHFLHTDPKRDVCNIF